LPAGVSPKPVKILLVEDHIDTSRVMTRVLKRMGHDVHTAGTVAAAIQTLESEPFEVLVSDISLPDGSGLDLMRRVRDANGKWQIHGIALTGLSMADDIQKCHDAGFEKHLAKPINPVQLQEAIQELAGSFDTAESRPKML
jgi:CheY-like chemotaxis protein